MKSIFAFFFFLVTFSVQAQNFTPGRVVVTRVGDGMTTLGGNTAPVDLQEYEISTANQATPSKTVSLGSGSTAGTRLTTAGNVAQSGQLSLSTDGKYLLLVGYD